MVSASAVKKWCIVSGQRCEEGLHDQRCEEGLHGQRCEEGLHGQRCGEGMHGQRCGEGMHGQRPALWISAAWPSPSDDEVGLLLSALCYVLMGTLIH